MGNSNNRRVSAKSESDNRRHDSRIRRLLQRLRPRDSVNLGSLLVCEQPSGECPVCCQPADVVLRYSLCPQQRQREADLMHSACRNCWLTFICTAIDSFAMGRLTCIGCDVPLNAAAILQLLQRHVNERAADPPDTSGAPSPCTACTKDCRLMFYRYEEFILRRALIRERDMRWCPRGCGYGLIAHGFKACPKLECQQPECRQSFCFICHRPWYSTDFPPELSASTSSKTASGPPHVCTFEDRTGVSNTDTFEGVAALFGLNRTLLTAIAPRASSVTPASPSHNTQPLMVSPRSSRLDSRSVAKESPVLSYSVHTDSLERTGSGDEQISFADRTSGGRRSTSSAQSTFSRYGADDVKACPNCGARIHKVNDGSCNAVKCSICNKDFCWLCRRPLSLLHFLSFSGCTAWGRRRWSVGKRVSVYCVTLLLAPFAVSLIIALLVPCGLFFLPVLFTTFVPELKSAWLTNYCKFLASICGFILAPVIIVLVLSLLIPFMLVYIYVFLTVALIHSVRQSYREPSNPPDPATSLEGSASGIVAPEDVEAGSVAGCSTFIDNNPEK